MYQRTHEPDSRLKDAPDVVKRLDVLRQQIEDVHHDVMSMMMEVKSRLEKSQFSETDLGDSGFLCREIMDKLDDARKEVKARMELASKILGVMKVAEFVANPSLAQAIHQCRICSAAVDVKYEAEIPKMGSDAYKMFMQFLGVDSGLIDDGVIKPDWKGLSGYITKRMERGDKIPPGIGKAWPIYVATFRRKSGKAHPDS